MRVSRDGQVNRYFPRQRHTRAAYHWQVCRFILGAFERVTTMHQHCSEKDVPMMNQRARVPTIRRTYYWDQKPAWVSTAIRNARNQLKWLKCRCKLGC